MESRLLLDVVIRQGAAVLQLFSSEDETLLVRGDALLVLNFGLDVLNRVGGLTIESDRLSGEGLNENLVTTAQTQHKMESGLLLDVVIG